MSDSLFAKRILEGQGANNSEVIKAGETSPAVLPEEIIQESEQPEEVVEDGQEKTEPETVMTMEESEPGQPAISEEAQEKARQETMVADEVIVMAKKEGGGENLGEKENQLKEELEEARILFANTEHDDRAMMQKLREALNRNAEEVLEDSPNIQATKSAYETALENYRNAEVEKLRASGVAGEAVEAEMEKLLTTINVNEKISLENAKSDARMKALEEKDGSPGFIKRAWESVKEHLALDKGISIKFGLKLKDSTLAIRFGYEKGSVEKEGGFNIKAEKIKSEEQLADFFEDKSILDDPKNVAKTAGKIKAELFGADGEIIFDELQGLSMKLILDSKDLKEKLFAYLEKKGKAELFKKMESSVDGKGDTLRKFIARVAVEFSRGKFQDKAVGE